MLAQWPWVVWPPRSSFRRTARQLLTEWKRKLWKRLPEQWRRYDCRSWESCFLRPLLGDHWLARTDESRRRVFWPGAGVTHTPQHAQEYRLGVV